MNWLWKYLLVASFCATSLLFGAKNQDVLIQEQTALGAAGQAVGDAADVVGQAVGQTVIGAIEVTGAVTHVVGEAIVDTVIGVVDIGDSVGQAVGDAVIEVYETVFEEENPFIDDIDPDFLPKPEIPSFAESVKMAGAVLKLQMIKASKFCSEKKDIIINHVDAHRKEYMGVCAVAIGSVIFLYYYKKHTKQKV